MFILIMANIRIHKHNFSLENSISMIQKSKNENIHVWCAVNGTIESTVYSTNNDIESKNSFNILLIYPFSHWIAYNFQFAVGNFSFFFVEVQKVFRCSICYIFNRYYYVRHDIWFFSIFLTFDRENFKNKELNI